MTFVLRAKRKKDSQTMIGQTDILNRKKGYGQEYMTLHYMVDKRKWTFKLTDRQTHIQTHIQNLLVRLHSFRLKED